MRACPHRIPSGIYHSTQLHDLLKALGLSVPKTSASHPLIRSRPSTGSQPRYCTRQKLMIINNFSPFLTRQTGTGQEQFMPNHLKQLPNLFKLCADVANITWARRRPPESPTPSRPVVFRPGPRALGHRPPSLTAEL